MFLSRKVKNNGFSSVLVVVSGQEFDGEIVTLACGLLGSRKDKVFIVYVIEVERSLPVDAEIGSATEKGEDILKDMESIAKPYKCDVTAELLQSRTTGPAVVHESVDKGVDAIILGVPYREAYGSFSMGETVPYVLKNAPCKVLIWRHLASLNDKSQMKA